MQHAKPMPCGLDQQGRYATRPEPAEACTEIGADAERCQELPLLVRLWLAFRRAMS